MCNFFVSYFYSKNTLFNSANELLTIKNSINMKKIFSAIISSPMKGRLCGLLFALLATTTLWAHDFEVDGVFYNILNENNVEVTYKGSYSDSYEEYSGEVTIPETVTYNGTTYSVTNIGDEAFYECSSLTSITIPNSVTSIGDDAFLACSSITNITLNDNITYIGESALAYTGISEIRLPNSLKTIEREAFDGCQNLREITIPENVETITGDLFNGCPLESVTWNAINCDDFGYNDGHHIESPFESRGDYIQHFNFGDKVKHIPASLCEHLRQVQEITLPNSVESIGNEAFIGCSNLTTITIPENIKRIGHNVFGYCDALTNVVWNAKNYVVQPDDDGAIYSLFGYDSNITSFVIGQHVEEFPTEMLYIMTSLNHIAVESGNTRYDSRSNCNAIIETATNTLLRGCNTTIIPQGVVVIGDNALSECRNIRSIEIPNTVTTIGSNAFSGCIALESITIPSSIQVIEQGAFSACPSIVSIKVDEQNPIFDSRNNCNAIIETATNVLLHGCQKTVIPDGVIGIGGGAFEDCAYLSAINIPSTVKTIGLGAFMDCSSLEHVEIGTGVETIEAYAFEECASLAYVNIPNNVTSVGEFAFESCEALTHATIGAGIDTIKVGTFGECDAMTHLVIGKNVKHIDTWAFAYCESLDTVYCYADVPPTIGEECFDGDVMASVLFVPCASLDAYQNNEAWKNMAVRIECIGSEQVTTDKVEISSTTTTVTITWPTEENADTYTIIINKGDETFCTLTFNADGQLLNITFAPARNGNNRVVQYATQTANGLRFTVTGLNEGTHYNYDITAKDKEENTLQSYSGEFTTQSYVPSSVENTDTQSQQSNTQKLLRNGQLIILRDGKTYNVMGQEL